MSISELTVTLHLTAFNHFFALKSLWGSQNLGIYHPYTIRKSYPSTHLFCSYSPINFFMRYCGYSLLSSLSGLHSLEL